MRKPLLKSGLVLAILLSIGAVVPSLGLYWTIGSDPTVTGIAAPSNQLLIRTDSPGLYFKSGTGPTQWTQLSFGNTLSVGFGWFGSGTDGALNFDGVNPVSGAAGPTVGVAPFPPLYYDLQRDVFGTTGNIPSGVTVRVRGYRPFFNETLTLNGNINASGSDCDQTACGPVFCNGPVVVAAGTVGGNAAGGDGCGIGCSCGVGGVSSLSPDGMVAGSTAIGGTNADGVNSVGVGLGGSGGGASTHLGPVAGCRSGIATLGTITTGQSIDTAYTAQRGRTFTNLLMTGGTGGGGSNGDESASNGAVGGGGGAGGGVLVVSAKRIIGTGNATANGGAGCVGAPSADGSQSWSGGAGGGGGTAVVITSDIASTINVGATGGLGTLGGGPAPKRGGNGFAGLSYLYRVNGP